MKKLSIALAALAYATIASAGEYHKSTALVCSDCHTMHASRSHQFGTALADTSGVGKDGAGHAYLLIQATVNDTCLACHAGTAGVPGVTATGGGSSTVGQRSAGFVSVGTADVNAPNGHTMGALVQPPGWNGAALAAGSGWTEEAFNCADCHGVHGNAGYRNLGNGYGRLDTRVTDTLGPFGRAITYAKKVDNTLVQTSDVTIMNAGANSTDTTKIAFGNGSDALPRLNEFCAKCHGNFHGAGTLNGTETIRHPTSGVVLAATWGPQFQLVRPLIGTGDNLGVNLTNSAPACLSCHKAHGNANPFAILTPNFTDATVNNTQGTFAASVNNETGDGSALGIRALCVSCHGQGKRFYTPIAPTP